MSRRSGHRFADKDMRKAKSPGPAIAMARMPARSELTLRVVSSAVLAPFAVALAYLGGWPFLVFWAIAACGIFWEWRAILRDPGPTLKGLGECAIAVAGASAMSGRIGAAAIFLGLGMAVEAVLATAAHFRLWAAAGVLYAGGLLIACVLLRGDAQYGLIAIVLLFAVVWTTDILAYFVGRFVGGPKLWARVSPKKTWSGAIGGLAGAFAASLVVAHYAHLANSLAVAALALVLSVASQAGDLFESAFKRRFGVKDAGHVIPGHGGIMDRLDGFLAAVVVAAVIGVARGGLEAPARGLLVW
jgi:phosphatidate cytidylyltransferase